MKLLHENHQLHFFSNNLDVEPSAALISEFNSQFEKHGLVPIVGNEVSINGNSGNQRQYLIMMTPDNKLRIEMPSTEIVIFREGCTQEKFQELTIEVLSGLKKLFPMKKANRLSVLNSKFFKGTEEEYRERYKKLFTYRKAEPFEWDNRIVQKKKLEKEDEVINSISTVRRCAVRSQEIEGGKSLDVIAFDIDSNTISQKNDMRFTINESKSVFEELFANNSTLTNEFGRYF